jgi:hypothetical protein
VVPDFSVAGGPRHAHELFVWDGKNLLQLTNRSTLALFVGSRRRALFTTTADPLGSNGDHNRQIFSIDTLGRRLRQLTRGHRWSGHLPCGARFGDRVRGCQNYPALQDPATNAIVFLSGCDLLSSGAFGGQLYAMRQDGSRLRQLTAAGGCTTDAPRAVTTELPGPFGYSAPSR